MGGEARVSRRSWMIRISVLAALWWVLTSGNSGSWIIGAPVVLLAAYLSMALRSASVFKVSALGLCQYLVFFVVESIRGGVDVARRAFLPGQHVNPHFLSYRTGLPSGLPRDILVNTLSLLPGTITANIEEDLLTLHALAYDMEPLESVKTCEQRVAALFSAAQPIKEI